MDRPLPDGKFTCHRCGHRWRSSFRVLIAVNPYEPAASDIAPPKKRGVATRRIVLAISLGILYAFTGLLILLLAYLPLRYPGLSDKESGPAYYWPDDLFYLLLPVTSVLLFVSMVVFLANHLRNRQASKPNLESTTT